MCGRYVAKSKPEDLAAEFGVSQLTLAERLEPDYNVAPSKPVYAVLERQPKEAPADTPPQRQLRVVKWGLVPSWAKDPSIGNRLINARVETASEKPAFRRAYAKRRCILPADGYYEWYQPLGDQDADAGGRSAPGSDASENTAAADGKPTKRARPAKPRKPPKQPFYLHRADGGTLAMAGLYELWRDESRDADDPEAWRWTAVVLTTNATDALGRIHDRMPLLVPSSAFDEWLAPRPVTPEWVDSVLVPAGPDLSDGRLEFTADPVSTKVNNVRNNGPDLIEPIDAEPIDAEPIDAEPIDAEPIDAEPIDAEPIDATGETTAPGALF
jgi:putative SOS response-associated peptidase YedK